MQYVSTVVSAACVAVLVSCSSSSAPEELKGAVAAEGDKLLAKLKPAERLVLLDEQGQQFSSRELAQRLGEWQALGDDIVFVIGGPDGVSAEVHERAAVTWSLSKLTLPHGLARVIFAEQLYRAWSLSTGHPYHRD